MLSHLVVLTILCIVLFFSRICNLSCFLNFDVGIGDKLELEIYMAVFSLSRFFMIIVMRQSAINFFHFLIRFIRWEKSGKWWKKFLKSRVS